jgi:hypothetical protein
MNDQIQAPGVPTVRAISSLLARHGSESLDKLRSAFPEYSDLFDPNYRLGEVKSVLPSDALNVRKSEALRALSKEGLEVANTRIAAIVPLLSRRIKILRRVKLTGAGISALSSAGVISALAISKPVVALVSGALGFLSSLVSLIGEHLEKPLVGEQKSIGEHLSKILEAESEARALSMQLRSGGGNPLKLAEQVNQIASVVRSVEVYSGLA